jgi:hypothetical protein
MATEMLTTTLNNGQIVLAKRYKGEIVAKHFANLTQAKAAAHEFGGYVRVGWPFYVVIPAV